MKPKLKSRKSLEGPLTGAAPASPAAAASSEQALYTSPFKGSHVASTSSSKGSDKILGFAFLLITACPLFRRGAGRSFGHSEGTLVKDLIAGG